VQISDIAFGATDWPKFDRTDAGATLFVVD
jgi:hypothetical protein